MIIIWRTTLNTDHPVGWWWAGGAGSTSVMITASSWCVPEKQRYKRTSVNWKRFAVHLFSKKNFNLRSRNINMKWGP